MGCKFVFGKHKIFLYLNIISILENVRDSNESTCEARLRHRLNGLAVGSIIGAESEEESRERFGETGDEHLLYGQRIQSSAYLATGFEPA